MFGYTPRYVTDNGEEVPESPSILDRFLGYAPRYVQPVSSASTPAGPVPSPGDADRPDDD